MTNEELSAELEKVCALTDNDAPYRTEDYIRNNLPAILAALRAAPAEPVAWYCPKDPDVNTAFKWKGTRTCDDCGGPLLPLYARPQAPSGWVSVKERLPKKNGMYLALRDGDALCELCAHIYHAGKWIYGDGSDAPEFPVTHWMPLPTPPSSEEG